MRPPLSPPRYLQRKVWEASRWFFASWQPLGFCAPGPLQKPSCSWRHSPGPSSTPAGHDALLCPVRLPLWQRRVFQTLLSSKPLPVCYCGHFLARGQPRSPGVRPPLNHAGQNFHFPCWPGLPGPSVPTVGLVVSPGQMASGEERLVSGRRRETQRGMGTDGSLLPKCRR